MKKTILMGMGSALIVVVVICFSVWFFAESGSAYYYTQIDNSRIEQGDSRDGVVDLSGGMSYYYTLPAYHENGEGKEITFGTSRELREGAFLRLTVTPVRGVIEWSEVQYDELPVNVQRYYERV